MPRGGPEQMTARSSAMISRCASCCTAVGQPGRVERHPHLAAGARRRSREQRLEHRSAAATDARRSAPAARLTPAIPLSTRGPVSPLHPAQVLRGAARCQVGRSTWVRTQPPAACSASSVGIRRAGPHPHARATTPPAGRPAPARSRAAARRPRRCARPVDESRWVASRRRCTRGEGWCRSSRAPVAPFADAPSEAPAPPARSAERPRSHRPSRHTWHTGRPVAAAMSRNPVTPCGAAWMHEDPPTAHRSPQPPPGRSLRELGQVAVVVRVRRTRVRRSQVAGRER